MPLKSFNSWFLELAALAQKADDSSNLPKLELLLRNGHVVEGHVIKLHERQHDQQIMILEPGDPYSRSELTCLQASEVVGMRILEVDKYLKSFVVPTAPKEVGSLELKRVSKDIETKLNEYFPDRISLQLNSGNLDEIGRGEVLGIIELLPSVFEKLTADDLGKKLIGQAIKSVEVIHSEVYQTLLEANVLKIQIGSPITLPVSQMKEKLIAKIEGLL